ncbi:MAG: FtsX-like permease family protein [Bacteroidales bacterium]|nr:FtsX-like permease family protein [Bacteroidales bacterium]
MLSLIGVAVASGALLIVLSIFNGLQDFIAQSVNAFNPDLEITSREGKVFPQQAIDLQTIAAWDDVQYCSEVLSDVVVFACEDRQFIAKLKGVRNDYTKMNRLDTMVEGHFVLHENDNDFAVLGGNIAYRLDCFAGVPNTFLKVYYPDRMRKNVSINNLSSLNSQIIIPSGVFYTYTEYDAEYVFVPIDFAKQLLGYDSAYTSVEIKCKEGKVNAVQRKLKEMYGDKFYVRNAYQQEEDLYKVMQSEKWGIYAILSFILVIAMFNIISMMTILILEKKEQIKVFYSMGADKTMIKNIFFYEGLLITGIGLLIGIVIGLLFCFLQSQFEFITFGDGSYLLSAYPVKIKILDVVMILLVVFLTTVPATYFPTRKLSVDD